jgi:molybdate transport system substrate-binding protein
MSERSVFQSGRAGDSVRRVEPVRPIATTLRKLLGALPGIATLVAPLGAAGMPRAAAAEELAVFAAASLTEALQEIAVVYERQQPGIHLVFNFAASSALARQIQEGARADVFFSADEAKMDGLEKKGLLCPGTRRSLLSNSLVIVVHRDSRLSLTGPADLLDPKFGHIALAEPQTVPAGIYAKEYLENQGLWSKLIDKVVPTENVRAALAAVESGNVDAGIVYETDAAISKNVRVAYEVATGQGPPISYPVAVLKESRRIEPAKRWVQFLESEEALTIFSRYGFLVNVPHR